jgi:hypothetical protein
MFAMFVALLIAGCAEPLPIITPEEEPEPEVTCRTITEQIPTTEEVCEDVDYTEEVCEKKKLEYTVTDVPKLDLCIQDGDCVGEPLKDCPSCSKAMTRCRMTITNDDPEKTGFWTVGANYSFDGAGFIKDPIIASIGPGESFTFDFNQMYNPNYPVTSTTCKLAVVDEPVAEICHDETRTESVCQDVQVNETVQREVCE